MSQPNADSLLADRGIETSPNEPGMTDAELATALHDVTSLLVDIWRGRDWETMSDLTRVYGQRVGAAWKAYLKHPSYLLGCFIDGSARVCERGQPGCNVRHATKRSIDDVRDRRDEPATVDVVALAGRAAEAGRGAAPAERGEAVVPEEGVPVPDATVNGAMAAGSRWSIWVKYVATGDAKWMSDAGNGVAIWAGSFAEAEEAIAERKRVHGDRVEYEILPAPAQPEGLVGELARVLLDVEWSATWVGDHPSCCPSCHGAKPGSFGIADDRQGHTKDCALLEALRKAGLR